MRTLITHFIFLGFFLPGLARAQGDSFLGISVEEDGRNVLIVEVTPKSPAEKAGLKIGDILLRLDGRRITDMDAFVDKVLAMPSGQSIELQIRRGDRQKKIKVVLGRRGESGAKPKVETKRQSGPRKKLAPVPERAPRGRGFLGVYLEGTDLGIRILDVIPGTAAERAGLKQGDTITRVGGKRVQSREAFVQTIGSKRAGQKLPLVLTRNGKRMSLSVTLGARPEENPAMRREAREAREHAEEQHAARERAEKKRAEKKRAAKQRAARERAGKERAARERAARRKADAARKRAAAERAKAREAQRKARQAARRKEAAARARATEARRSEAPGREAVWLRNYSRARRLAESSSRPLVIDFYADWCRPCRMLDQSFEAAEVRKVLADCVLVKVDVDQDERLADEFGVSSIPLVVVMDAAGKKLGSMVGYRPADELAERLSTLVGRWAARARAPEKAKSKRKPKPKRKATKVAKSKTPKRKAARKAQPARNPKLQKELRQILDMQRKLQRAIDRLRKKIDQQGGGR